MAVLFHIPGYLREFTAGRSQVRLESSPATVGEALDSLWRVYPGVRDRVVDQQGTVRQHVNVFVGDENIRWTGWLETQVAEGAEISIIPAVSGGGNTLAGRGESGRPQPLPLW